MFYISLLSLYPTCLSWERLTQILVHAKFTAYKRGWFLVKRIANFLLCDSYLVASRLCRGKADLKIRYHKRGLSERIVS